MTHDVLVTTVWSVHAALLTGVAAAYYKYGDRSEAYTKSLQGTDGLLGKLRRRLSSELGTHLAPIIKTIQDGAVTSPILGPNGETYAEKPPAIGDSEEFRESMQRFVDRNGDVMVDYRSALLAKVKWCFWARVLSWCSYIALIWTGAVASIVFVFGHIFEVHLPDAMLRSLWVVTVLAVGAVVLPLPFQLRAHDKLCHLRMLHDVP